MVGGEYVLVILFELVGNVRVGIEECVVGNGVVGEFMVVEVGELDIVREEIVIGDFEGGNGGKVSVGVVYVEKIVVGGIGYGGEVVELGI